MPSKTFHFGPDPEEVVLDLFAAHLQLTALLEASTRILAERGDGLPGVALAIARADQHWMRLWRHYEVFPPDPT